MRLDKYISLMSVNSRKEAKKLIKKGKVSVNFNIEKNSAYKLNEIKDVVEVEKIRLQYRKYEYVMLNKPTGYVTATKDKEDKTIYDLIDAYLKKREVSSIGRLDKDTEGLIILTDDGKLIHNIISPNKKVPKKYYVKVDKPIGKNEVERFKEGLYIGEGKKTKPSILDLSKEDNKECYLTIYEGKFHQVKRMFYETGHVVKYLKRVEIGGVKLDNDLEVGNYRYLKEEEIKKLISIK